MLFVTLTSDEYFHFDTDNINKYLNSIERLDSPFFIRYMFSRNMLKNRKQFQEYKSRLEKSEFYTSINMAFGDTATQRKNVIEKLMTFDKPILDIGWGEGFYAIPFSQKIEKFNYHAIDIEKILTETVKKKALKKEITNIITYNHINEYILNDKGTLVDIILTEVIEHMPVEDSKHLLGNVFKNINFEKMVITVPNKNFNQFYMIDEESFRHDDHKWEPTKKEFQELMTNVIPEKFKYEFINIGDMVNDIHTSIGCVITK